MAMAIRRHLEYVNVFPSWDGLEGSKYLIRSLEDSGMAIVKVMGMGCLTLWVLLVLVLWDSN